MVTKEDIFDLMMEIDIDVDRVSHDTSKSLREQGLDSLDMVRVLFELEKRFAIEMTEDDIQDGKLGTIDLMLEFINSAQAANA